MSSVQGKSIGILILKSKLHQDLNRITGHTDPKEEANNENQLIQSYLRNRNKTLSEYIREFEKKILIQALFMTSGNQRQAAYLLGIKENTLSYKMKVMGLKTDATWIS